MLFGLFFLTALAAGLTWTAVFIAAAVRVRQGWQKRLLIATGEVLPPIAWLPWVTVTAFMTFGLGTRAITPTWFPQVFTVFVATAVGSIWLAIAGLRTNRFTQEPVARAWALGPLLFTFVASKTLTAGVLLGLDHDVLMQAQFLRVEAASLMQSNLPPMVSDDDNAAPLYLQAFAALEGDPDLNAVEQLVADQVPDLLERPEVTAALSRHATTLLVLEQAASRDVCRFTRNWTRPSFAMLLPEIQAMRRAARLVDLASQRDAAEGNTAAALAKVEMIQAFAAHAAGEPLLITMLVGFALDNVADQALARILPTLTADDQERLNSLAHPDITSTLPRALFGEEAFGLAAFADVIDGTHTLTELIGAERPAGFFGPDILGKQSPIGALFRVFLIPADLAGYRRFLHAYQQLAAGGQEDASVRTRARELEAELTQSSPGILSSLVLPALNSVFEARLRTDARHASRTILIAATRQRLATGSLPATLEELDPQWLPLPPRDPFTGTTHADRASLRYRLDDQGLTVWSIGPNGEDDGGPLPKAAQTGLNPDQDDIGLTMPLVNTLP